MCEDELIWVKSTARGKLRPNIGRCLMRATEHCVIFRKGYSSVNQFRCSLGIDAIHSELMKYSQNPEELYARIQKAIPAGTLLEIFARNNNVRSRCRSVGVELEYSAKALMSFQSGR